LGLVPSVASGCNVTISGTGFCFIGATATADFWKGAAGERATA